MKHWKSRANQDTERCAWFLNEAAKGPSNFQDLQDGLIARHGMAGYRKIFSRATKLIIGRCVRSYGEKYFTKPRKWGVTK